VLFERLAALVQSERVFCSRRCMSIAGSRAAHLAVHGAFTRRLDGASKRAVDRERCARRRARLAAAVVEVVEPDVVYERDGWRCHVCRGPVDRTLSGRHRLGPTLDHLVPLALGGEHSYANTALAHRACNSSKGVRGGNTQLALVG
jgi:5-methylcytosine-specific restriction endonuclease McrA